MSISHTWARNLSTARSGPELFGVPQELRRKHLYLIGRTGSGKTTLLHNMIVQDIEAGQGLCFVDLHGDASRKLLDEIPGRRFGTDKVLVFDPSDLEHPVGLNLLGNVAPDDRPLVASNVVSIFKHTWAESWGPRTEYLLSNCVRALLDCPPELYPTLMEIPRLLVQEGYRNAVVRHIRDAKVRSFWEDEFGQWDKRFRGEVDRTAAE